MLYREILTLDPDICCLQVRSGMCLIQFDYLLVPIISLYFISQEVDRTEKLFPVLENAGYAQIYAAGPRKKHGCAIVFRKSLFALVGEKVVMYDEESVRLGGSDETSGDSELVQRKARASTRVTKNIASLVALKRVDGTNDGVVVATTHLFWHPKCVN